MGDQTGDDSDEKSDDTDLFVWEAIQNDASTDTDERSTETSAGTRRSGESTDTSPVTDGQGESPDSEDDVEETEPTGIEQLIAEDPMDTGPDAEDTERTETTQARASSSDRIWNRIGTGDEDPEPQSGPPSDTSQNESDEAEGEHGQTRGTAGETDTTAVESDRLWNERDSGTGRTDSADSERSDATPAGFDRSDASPTDLESSDASPTDLESSDASPTDLESSDATPTGGGADTDEGDETSESQSSFDHLLNQSESGGGNPRPVGSPSVETDLDAFFDDLEEFDRATSGSQVLVISPRGHSITDDVCSHFLTAGGVSGRNALFVTAEDPPAERVEICRSNENWSGGEIAVIELGNTVSGSEERLDPIGGEEVIQKRVNSPKNLSKTGLLITQTLKKWSTSDQPSILCFHTLTALGGYVENETLFQFLFTLQAKLDSHGVTGHYHMDAGRHDQQEINTLKTLFDLVITISQNGEIEVE